MLRKYDCTLLHSISMHSSSVKHVSSIIHVSHSFIYMLILSIQLDFLSFLFFFN